MRGFSPSVSDIDVLVVVEDDPPLHAATLRHLGDRLVALPAPGRGLHLSIVTAARAHAPSAPWPFLLHVATAPADTKVIVGIGHHGDPDLVMHYTVVRAAGITVTGQAPAATIGVEPSSGRPTRPRSASCARHRRSSERKPTTSRRWRTRSLAVQGHPPGGLYCSV